MDMSLSKPWELVKDREAWHTAVHGGVESDRVEQLSNKQWNPDTCYNVNELPGYYTEWNKPDTRGQILYDSIYVRSLEQST